MTFPLSPQKNQRLHMHLCSRKHLTKAFPQKSLKKIFKEHSSPTILHSIQKKCSSNISSPKMLPLLKKISKVRSYT